MVLEVVSSKSVRKDTQVLRRLYWKAGIAEYWLVDARKEAARFEISTARKPRYTATRPRDGWLWSDVLRPLVRLGEQADPLGHPRYTLDVWAALAAPRQPTPGRRDGAGRLPDELSRTVLKGSSRNGARCQADVTRLAGQATTVPGCDSCGTVVKNDLAPISTF